MTSRKVLAHSLTFLASLRLVLSCHASGIIIMTDSCSERPDMSINSRTASKLPESLESASITGNNDSSLSPKTSVFAVP